MRTRKGVELPDALEEALGARPDVMDALERMRPSCQREYADWVAEAKRPETRAARAAKVLERVEEWASRHPGPAGGARTAASASAARATREA